MKKRLGKFANELLDWMKDAGRLYDDIVSKNISIGRMTRPTYYRTLRDLQRQELIKKIEQNKRKKENRKKFHSTYVLTNKGKSLVKTRTTHQRRSDGYSTLIIFDIPEEKAKQRTIFRRFLQRSGYTLLQESVLIGGFSLSQDTKDLIQELGIRNFVTILSAKVHHNI